jgi:hypothetical protein
MSSREGGLHQHDRSLAGFEARLFASAGDMILAREACHGILQP